MMMLIGIDIEVIVVVDFFLVLCKEIIGLTLD